MNENTWESVINYLEERMNFIRGTDGKFDKAGGELWLMKKAMQEVDPSIENVGESFIEYENEINGGNK